ncbi:hypothetical protein MSAN_00950600 [Mycena sanguinolenta]|uniref:DUF7702 domain-containing protein n=1 Tax=Mycena sanguinolenta TaxID=230812 RepID=A0A8H6YY91_9AGAR|nr:hypothetical protein MSAN_00950600 [Mycena sanguinolenta]
MQMSRYRRRIAYFYSSPYLSAWNIHLPLTTLPTALHKTMSYDYASAFGIHSVAAAVIFAVLYLPLSLWFIRQSIKNTTYVYIILTLFCAMRLTAFIIRAILADSTKQASNEGLFIADEVLFGIGFFALLYSAYSLVLDRDVIAGGEGPAFFSLNLLRNPNLFRMLLTAGVAVSIIGTTDSTSTNPTHVSTGLKLHKAGIAIFFALTIVQMVQTAWYFREEHSLKSSERKFGDRNGPYLLSLISILMLVREVFFIATLNNSARQNEEQLWYPLVAVPEFMAVLCYSVSGLVPTRAALKAARQASGSI